jgi:hypothetical protein
MFKEFGQKVQSWELLSDGLQPHLAEMPFLQPLYDELRAAIEQARDLLNVQESARSQLRGLVEQRRQIELDGEAFRSRAAAYLRGRFGFKSKQLIEFGLSPLASKPKRKKDEPLPPNPE